MRKALNLQNFPNKLFGVTAIVLLVALLLMLKPIATKFKDLLNFFKIETTPEAVQEAAGDIFTLAAGIILVIVGLAAAVFGAKVALIATGVAVVAYSAYKVYEWVSSWPIFGKSEGANYGDTDLNRGA
jgi:hypothetical protein